MNGRRSRNPDPKLFFANGQLIEKHPKNTSQKRQEVNDWVFGRIDKEVLGGWSKYKGGPIKEKESYDTTDYYNPNDFPDL